MTDNKELDKQIEPLLNEMLLTLAAFCHNNNKKSIEYAARISNGHTKECIYTINFTINDAKGTKNSDDMD